MFGRLAFGGIAPALRGGAMAVGGIAPALRGGAMAVLTFCLLSVAAPALAQTKVIVLGLRSIEGDDETANALTDRLRTAAGSVEGWAVSPAAVSMAQMSLAHGCEEIDASCLDEIAEGLKTDVVIYGTLRRNSARENYDFALNVSLYDARAGVIAKIVDDTVPREEAGAAAHARAQKLLSRLASTSHGGTIAIQANTLDAEVRVNGQQVGHTRDGALRLGGLQPGQYRIEIVKDGYVPHVSTVTVAEGVETSIAAVLSTRDGRGGVEIDAYEEETKRGHRLGWLGWTLIGVSAVSLVGMGLSMAVINDIDDDPGKTAYSDAVARGNDVALDMNQPEQVIDDVCVAARRGLDYTLEEGSARDVADKCDTAETMQVLQYVFLGTAVAAGATGLALVLTEDDSPEDRGRARGRTLALRPHFGTDGGGVSATLRF